MYGQNFHFFLEISQILAVFRFKKSELITKIFAGGVRCGVAKVKTLNILRFGFGIRIQNFDIADFVVILLIDELKMLCNIQFGQNINRKNEKY